MKAAVLCANEDIRYMDYAEPEVGAGEVKVRVRRCGICGSDVPRVLHHGAHGYPIVLGHEFSGDVAQVGEGVEGIAVGQRVSVAPLLPCHTCADCLRGDFSLCKHYSFIGSRVQGAFAEYVVAPQENIVVMDDAMSYDAGALLEPATVALHGLFCNDFKGGGHVAILGAGTIGLFAAQWCRIYGARSVTVLDIDDSRLELARRMGVDHTLNTKDAGYAQACRDITEGRGFDDIFEAAGTPATIQMAFELAGNHAKVCMIGTPHGEVRLPGAVFELLNRREFHLTGSWMSYSAPFPGREWELAAHHFARGDLRVEEGMIFARYPLGQTAEAFALYRTPGLVQGKILIDMDI